METETSEQRFKRERDERRRESEKREIASKAEMGQSPVNRARLEEARQTFRELRGHAAPAARAVQQPSESGSPMKFAAYDDSGTFGEITLSAISPFTPRDP